MNQYIKYILLLIPFLLLASTNDRALYIKKYSNESKTALVIGNAEYKHFSKLKNSKNDARDISNILKSLDFEVLYLEDGNLKEMKNISRKFATKLKKGGVGFFYYAGHGLEVEGKNFLIPTNANIPSKVEVEYESLAVNRIIDMMEDASNRLNIVVLDACRNDPFSRSGGGGLAAINNAKGMYIAYATAPGEVASDGSGKNGLFTKHLITNIKNPNLTLNQVFDSTRADVYNESRNKQLPWTSSSVIGTFYFNVDGKVKPQQGRKEYPKAQNKPKVSSDEQTFWYVVKEENTPEYYQLYLQKYPQGYYADDAQYFIDEIKEKEKQKKRKEKEQKEKLAWEKIKDSTYGEDFQKFLSEYPDSKYALFAQMKEKKYKDNIRGIKDKHGNIYQEVKSPYTGRVWLDRNLGAKRVCTSYNDEQCYGDYFQWGRNSDGHEKQNSATTSSLSYSDTPNHSKFIKSPNDLFSWLNSQNDNLWQGVNGKNNPCPKGFRIPTLDELKAETLNQGVKHRDDAYKSFLKLPSAGVRNYILGSVEDQGSYGYVWSSVPNLGATYSLGFTSDDIYEIFYNQAGGLSVRCVKDY
jgi:hypothetical protein